MDSGNQIAAVYEEHINADEAAAKSFKPSMKHYDGQHSQRPNQLISRL